MRYKILTILITAFCSLAPLSLQAREAEEKTEFASRKLKQLSELLPLQSFPEQDTILEVPQVITGKSLVFLLNEKKMISHIGVSLFSHETKQMLDNDICNFLERCFLELLLQKDQAGVKAKLSEYHISLSLNGQEFGTGSFRSVSHILQVMDMPANFALRHKEKQAEAAWAFGNYQLCMVFPLYRELIDGMDKKESDKELYHSLQVAVFTPVELEDEPVSPADLQPFRGDVYVRKGEKFMIQHLSSDRYYGKEADGGFGPLFSAQYPEYSMSNLFLTFGHAKGKMLQIAHRQYGHFTPEISIPLLNFLACFKDDFLTACHTGYNKKGELETMIVFSHKTLNYIHLMRVHIAKEQLFAAAPVLQADFYSNIPQHYINSLLK